MAVAEFSVNIKTADEQSKPTISMIYRNVENTADTLTEERVYGIAWVDKTNSNYVLKARLFKAMHTYNKATNVWEAPTNSAILGDQELTLSSAFESIGTLSFSRIAKGGFIAVWQAEVQGKGVIYFRVFDDVTGKPINRETVLEASLNEQSNPRVQYNKSGDVSIVWEERDNQDKSTIRHRSLDPLNQRDLFKKRGDKSLALGDKNTPIIGMPDYHVASEASGIVSLPNTEFKPYIVKIVQDLSGSISGAGGDVTFILMSNGALLAAGYSDERFGKGRTLANDSNAKAFIKVLDSVTDFSLGKNHAVAIRTDGSAWASGANDFGQIGAGSIFKKIDAWQVSMEDAKQVVAGYRSTYVITKNNILLVCGGNKYYQLGTGDTETQTSWKQSLTDVAQVFIGIDSDIIYNEYAYALKTDGTLMMVGKRDITGWLFYKSWTQIAVDVKTVFQANHLIYVAKNDGQFYKLLFSYHEDSNGASSYQFDGEINIPELNDMNVVQMVGNLALTK